MWVSEIKGKINVIFLMNDTSTRKNRITDIYNKYPAKLLNVKMACHKTLAVMCICTTIASWDQICALDDTKMK